MFKNMQLYWINNTYDRDLLSNSEALNDALAGVPEALPTGSQWRRLGWGMPKPGHSDSLVWEAANRANLITLYIHERQLTGATIREHVLARAKKIEEKEQRKCYRKELAQIRDEVEANLLPKAFIKHSFTNVLIHGDLLIVDASTAKKAEDALDCLRQALGQLSVTPVRTKLPMTSVLTEIMRDRDPDATPVGWNMLAAAKLVNSDKAKASFSDCDLSDDEPQGYLEQGFYVAEMALQFDQVVRFKLTDQLVFKSIKVEDMHLAANKADANGDMAAEFDGTIIIFVDLVHKILQSLLDVAGDDRPEMTTTEPEIRSVGDLVDAADDEISQGLAASVASLSQRFRIGYSKAAGLLGLLVEAGLVAGEPDEHGVYPLKATLVQGDGLSASERKALMDDELEQSEESEEDRLFRLHGNIASAGAEPGTQPDDEEDEFDVAARRLREKANEDEDEM